MYSGGAVYSARATYSGDAVHSGGAVYSGDVLRRCWSWLKSTLISEGGHCRDPALITSSAIGEVTRGTLKARGGYMGTLKARGGYKGDT